MLNVGTAHVGEFGSTDGDRGWPSASSSRRCPAHGTAVLNADDVRRRRDGRVDRRLGAAGSDAGSDADVTASGVALDDEGRPSFRLHTPSGSADVAHAAGRRAPRGERARRGGDRHRAGLDVDVIAAALSAAGRAQPMAHGGAPPPGRRHGDQRRVQRQPGQRAGGAARTRRGRAWWPDLGRAR